MIFFRIALHHFLVTFSALCSRSQYHVFVVITFILFIKKFKKNILHTTERSALSCLITQVRSILFTHSTLANKKPCTYKKNKNSYLMSFSEKIQHKKVSRVQPNGIRILRKKKCSNNGNFL